MRTRDRNNFHIGLDLKNLFKAAAGNESIFSGAQIEYWDLDLAQFR
jgi:hypothetical protein